jgi:hypothetical protein
MCMNLDVYCTLRVKGIILWDCARCKGFLQLALLLMINIPSRNLCISTRTKKRKVIFPQFFPIVVGLPIFSWMTRCFIRHCFLLVGIWLDIQLNSSLSYCYPDLDLVWWSAVWLSLAWIVPLEDARLGSITWNLPVAQIQTKQTAVEQQLLGSSPYTTNRLGGTHGWDFFCSYFEFFAFICSYIINNKFHKKLGWFFHY